MGPTDKRQPATPLALSEQLLQRLERYAASAGTTPRALLEGLLAGFLDEVEKLKRVN